MGVGFELYRREEWRVGMGVVWVGSSVVSIRLHKSCSWTRGLIVGRHHCMAE